VRLTDDPVTGADAAELAAVTVSIAETRAALAAYFERRDELVVRLARNGATYTDIAALAEITDRGVGKVVRAAGVRRYRQRSTVPGSPPGATPAS
jgi:hypothetical protein